MNITLEEWLTISRAAREAQAVLNNLSQELSDVLMDHYEDEEIRKFVEAVKDRVLVGENIAHFLQLQPDWEGDDCCLREPSAVGIVNQTPQIIPGSRGVKDI